MPPVTESEMRMVISKQRGLCNCKLCNCGRELNKHTLRKTEQRLNFGFREGTGIFSFTCKLHTRTRLHAAQVRQLTNIAPRSLDLWLLRMHRFLCSAGKLLLIPQILPNNPSCQAEPEACLLKP